MFKKVIIAIITCLIFGGIFFLKDNIFPYKGEILASKGVYHKTNCELVKYSFELEIKLYPSYHEAIKENNRPCKTCNPKWYTVEEVEEVKKQEEIVRKQKEAIKIQESKDKELNDQVETKVEERKQEILSGTKNDLTDVEIKWRNLKLGLEKYQTSAYYERSIERELHKQIEIELERNLNKN